MTTQSSRRALQLRLWALFMFFFIPGLLMASWATRTPAIRDLLALSTAEMGVVLFGLSVGSMSGILCSAWLVKRFGTRKVIRTTMSFAVLGMLVLSLALWVTSAPLFAFGLAIFGASFGSAEVAINVEGAAIEREMNKTVLPMMHGFYSFGTLFGAGVGMAVTGFGLPAARTSWRLRWWLSCPSPLLSAPFPTAPVKMPPKSPTVRRKVCRCGATCSCC